MTPYVPSVGEAFKVRRPTGYESTAVILAVFEQGLHIQVVWTYKSHIDHGYVIPDEWNQWPSLGGVQRSTLLDFFSTVLECAAVAA